MQDPHTLNSVMVVRRAPRRLPSIRRHAIWSILCLLLVLGLIAVAIAAIGNPKDAISNGQVGIEPPPLPPAHNTLNGDTSALPDLLDGIVPDGANPTERLDALGNPMTRIPDTGLVGGERLDALGNPIARTPDTGLVGGETPRIIPIQPQSSGPRTILIDGQPINGDGGANPAASPLVRAPLPALTRSSPFGRIPTPAPDGRKAVTTYARPFVPMSGKNQVSVVIGGLGINRALTRRAIYELPADVTLSFAAHAPNLQSLIDQARAQGHEVMLELPMESIGDSPNANSNDHTLKVIPNAGRNIRNLDWLMSRGLGYFAVTNYNGDALLTRSEALSPILTHLSNAGLGFIFDGSISAPTLSGQSARANLPFTQAYSVIDQSTDISAIEVEYLRLEAQASSGQIPIGIGFAYANTINSMKTWISTLPDKNLQLAPASYVLNNR